MFKPSLNFKVIISNDFVYIPILLLKGNKSFDAETLNRKCYPFSVLISLIVAETESPIYCNLFQLCFKLGSPLYLSFRVAILSNK